jgi:soluble lytic murein transglycosylase-like protein
MIDIESFAQRTAARLRTWWERLPATQQLLLHGMGIVVGVLMLGGLAGIWGPRTTVASIGELAYTGTAARQLTPAWSDPLTTGIGDQEIARLQLGREAGIEEFSSRYQITADLSELIYETSLRQGLDPELAFRLVQMESQFHAGARSHADAVGLAQVQLATARFYDPEITVHELYDPGTNLRIGLSFLRDLIRTYGDVELALLAYNWGPSRLKELLAEGRDPRNGYASSIMEGYLGTW